MNPHIFRAFIMNPDYYMKVIQDPQSFNRPGPEGLSLRLPAAGTKAMSQRASPAFSISLIQNVFL